MHEPAKRLFGYCLTGCRTRGYFEETWDQEAGCAVWRCTNCGVVRPSQEVVRPTRGAVTMLLPKVHAEIEPAVEATIKAFPDAEAILRTLTPAQNQTARWAIGQMLLSLPGGEAKVLKITPRPYMAGLYIEVGRKGRPPVFRHAISLLIREYGGVTGRSRRATRRGPAKLTYWDGVKERRLAHQ